MPSGPSMSTITRLAGPGCSPMFAFGVLFHDERIFFSSVLAFLKPFLVSGVFPLGLTGNTGIPRRAYSSAAFKSAVT